MKPGMFILAGIAAGLLASWGCGSPEARYKILGFFFDGVPPPAAEDRGGVREDDTPAPAPLQADPRLRYTGHGPYAAKMCDACHRPGTNRLILPLEQLCLSCHVLPADGRIVHGPLASGGCRVCHNPHGSAYPYLLVSDSKDFCLHCHERSDVLSRSVHRETDAECITCHDAHSADNPFLLK